MATRRSGLGKGLGALIPTVEPGSAKASVTQVESAFREVAIDSVEPNAFQPRKHLVQKELEPLAASIKELGVLQPLLVRKQADKNDKYELIAGERRWRASQIAGLKTVPVIIREAADNLSLEEALVENLHRKDLNAIDEAAAYQQLIDDFSMSHEAVGKRMGKSRAAVSNLLRLLSLQPKVQKLLVDGMLSEGHGRALLGTSDAAFQAQLAERAAKESWSVRAVEEAVKAREGGVIDVSGRGTSAGKATMSGEKQDAPALVWQERLGEFLDTKVSVQKASKRGRITIDFADIDDLARIGDLICQVSRTKRSS